VNAEKVKARITGGPSVRTRKVFPQQVATAQFHCMSFAGAWESAVHGNSRYKDNGQRTKRDRAGELCASQMPGWVRSVIGFVG
jgi:hypothetical protein